MRKILTTAALCLFAACLYATDLSPEGHWATIDDETGEVKSHVVIWLENGELKGKIEKLINPEEPNPVCEACKGKLKNQPITGMTFIWGLKKKGEEWQGGRILDPANGKEYKAKIKVIDEGKALEVRGFIGLSLIGRTQTWQRIDH